MCIRDISFPFGILAEAFRGWRWKQTLEPLGERSRTSVRLNAVFLSYAVSLVIPRIGEFARCGVLNRYDNVSFPKALGTVVTERVIDTISVSYTHLDVYKRQVLFIYVFLEQL